MCMVLLYLLGYSFCSPRASLFNSTMNDKRNKINDNKIDILPKIIVKIKTSIHAEKNAKNENNTANKTNGVIKLLLFILYIVSVI